MNPNRIKKNNDLMSPGICFICESARDVPFVDMERNHDPEGFVILRGRKYLCEICVKDAAEALDIFGSERVGHKAEIDSWQEENASLEDRIEALKASQIQVLSISDVQELLKPKPRASKPKAEPVE